MAAMNDPGAPKIPAPQIYFPARSASDNSELPGQGRTNLKFKTIQQYLWI